MLLNRRSEIMKKCIHKDKLMLCNFQKMYEKTNQKVHQAGLVDKRTPSREIKKVSRKMKVEGRGVGMYKKASSRVIKKHPRQMRLRRREVEVYQRVSIRGIKKDFKQMKVEGLMLKVQDSREGKQ